MRRDVIMATRRVRAATGRLAIVRRARIFVRATIVAAKSAPTRRAASVATRVRRSVSPSENSATKNPMRRATVTARSGPIPRAAKVFGKTAGRRAIARIVRDRRGMAIGPAAIVRSENLAATRSFRAARRIATATVGIAAATVGIARATVGIARATVGIAARARILATVRPAANPSRGKSAKRVLLIHVPPAVSTNPVTTSRAATAVATSVHVSRARATIAQRVSVPVATGLFPIVRSGSGRSSIAPGRTVRSSTAPAGTAKAALGIATATLGVPKAAPTGRSIHAATNGLPADLATGRAATTRTTARFLQSVRRSAAAAPIASASPNSTSVRIAKVVSRAGLASRRDAEEWIVQGRVTVNGRVINSPALDVTANDAITVDGKPLPPRERTRLFLFHKPRGLMTTHADPEGRPTVFDNLPEGLPRLISVGRLDFNTEGLLLLTNDGGLARALELPDTGWLRRYRVRAHGEVTQAQLDELKKGVEVDGVKYGSIDATLERDQGANVWLVFAIREGKNREVRNVMAHLGLEVNRLIRVSYGPFQLAELEEGQVEEVKTRVLREQLGEKIAELAGADFNRPMPGEANDDAAADGTPRGKKPFKPSGKSALIADRKGRRVLVQRTGSEEARARNEAEANGYGPPRRPQRGYHGKRDLKSRDE
jgi:pseudouridine synthase